MYKLVYYCFLGILINILISSDNSRHVQSTKSQTHAFKRYIFPRPKIIKDTQNDLIAHNRIVFISKISNYYQIFVMYENGTGLVQLTKDRSDHISPHWSPDKRWILYQVELSTNSTNKNLWIMNSDGSNKHELMKNVMSASWNLINSMIVCDSADLSIQHPTYAKIYLISPVNRRPQLIMSGKYVNYLSPSWSSDGHHLAYSSDYKIGNFNIWIADADGRHRKQLTHNSVNIKLRSEKYDAPDWSPDGTLIVCNRQSKGIYDLCLINVKSKSISYLTGCGEECADYIDDPAPIPKWSPDGKWIAFISNIISGYNSQIAVTDSLLRTSKFITSVDDDVRSISWFKDSQQILFSTKYDDFDLKKNEVKNIFYTNVSKGPFYQLSNSGNNEFPQW